MNKEEISKEFEMVEKQLLRILKGSFIKIEETNKSKTVVEAIKKQIEKVGEAKMLLEKYETLAKLLYDFSDDGQAALEKSEEKNIKPANNVNKLSKKTTKAIVKSKKQEKQRESC